MIIQQILDNKLVSTQTFTEDFEKKINQKVIECNKQIQRKENPIKITTGAIAAVLTILWIFPSNAKEHPFLKGLFNSEETITNFSIAWLVSVYIFCALWLLFWIKENKRNGILKNLNLEFLQNTLFQNYIVDNKAIKINECNLLSKSDFTNYLMAITFDENYNAPRKLDSKPA